jgi:diguanylate cyclase (GGDEF)-like protein/PAS domain S-box-containing protein
LTSTDAENELGSEYEALLSFMYLSPIGLVRSDMGGLVDMMNPMAARLLMPLVKDCGLSNILDALATIAPELRTLVSEFEGERGAVCENYRLFVRPAKTQPIVLACSLIKVGENLLMTVLTDISRQVVAERRVQQTESWLAGICTNIKDFAFFTLDEHGRVEAWNSSIERLAGFSADDVVGKPLDLFYGPDQDRDGRLLEQVALARDDGWHMQECWCETKSGRRFWGQILVCVLREDAGGVSGYSVVIRDTSERRVTTDNLERLLTTDHLTGAHNRAHFIEVAEAEIARAKRHARPLSLVMLDADHFKTINDTAGHKAGDEVLKRLVAEAKGILRPSDAVGRLGGEEFALLLPQTLAQEAVVVAQRLRALVERSPVAYDGLSLKVTISLGVASLSGPNDDLDGLLEAADRALYEAKRSGRNCVCVVDAQADGTGRGSAIRTKRP